jgi:hypothetical protein
MYSRSNNGGHVAHMEFIKRHPFKIALMAGASICALAYFSDGAWSADLGGNCCADLEERIAELEATTAKKGNRKMSVRIYGELNKAIEVWDGDVTVRETRTWWGNKWFDESASASFKDQKITENSNTPSFVGIEGSAQFSPGWRAGYTAEIGVGEYDDDGTNGIYTNKAFAWVGNDTLGKLSIGHNSQATDDLDRVSVANTGAAQRPLSLRPIIGPQTGEVLDLFDGTRADVVRYDSAVLGGFIASASWASGGESDDAYDVALRYAGEFSSFRVAAGVGYRKGIVLNSNGWSGVIPSELLDTDTYSAVLSVMHVPSGLFLTGNYGKIDGSAANFLKPPYDLDAEGWALTGGIEQKWVAIGKTTLFGEFGDTSLDAGRSPSCNGFCDSSYEKAEVGVRYYGFGIVQNLENAAADLYANVRVYDGDLSIAEGCKGGWCGSSSSETLDVDVDATVFTAGARIRF